MERWVVSAKKADFNRIGSEFGIDPVVARIIRNREVIGDEAIEEYLHGTLKELPSPKTMKGMQQAEDILGEAIQKQKKIRIIGDYDIDGVMSTYILWKGLTRLGAVVDVCIPDRIQDGYGLHKHLVERAKEDRVELILTCDNGISAFDEITYAKELGIQVVVTDHHDIPFRMEGEIRREVLPPADAIVNPKQADCPYPFKELCGAVVAYKLVQVLYRKDKIAEQESEELLELAAIATVGDVMDLLGENRIIVKEGLKRLQNPSNLGIQALIEANHLEEKELGAYHIGFVLGPCINASGRLDTALRSLELLKSSTKEEAARLAGDLVAINQSRKDLTARGVEQAMELVEKEGLLRDRVLVIYLPECHESLAGIIAGRLREAYHRPTIVLTRGEESVKGSGRSIEAYSMYEELTRCRDLLLVFGGHPMAAGMSLEEENVLKLRERLNALCTLTSQELLPKIVIDVPMPLGYLSRNLVEELQLLEPFGKANPRPVFAQKAVHISDTRILGKNQNVVQMKIKTAEGVTFSGVYFGDGREFQNYIKEKETIDIIYYPQLHSWQGRESLRITVQNYQ